jgi:delta 1-pyrroline-5-carboxylate dehydrogenase
MKLTSDDALRLEEIRKAQEEWDALPVDERSRLLSERATYANADVRVLLELVDRILPDFYDLTPQARALLGDES